MGPLLHVSGERVGAAASPPLPVLRWSVQRFTVLRAGTTCQSQYIYAISRREAAIMRLSGALLFFLATGLTLCAAQNDRILGHATIKQNVHIADTDTEELPFPQNGQVLQCHKIESGGYQVLCYDLKGHSRVALLPMRDEWGRPTATTWKHDPALAEDTIVIRTPVAMKPGRLTLKRNEEYPVTGAGEQTYTIIYTRHDLSFSFEIPKEAATLELENSAGADPARRRERALRKEIERSNRKRKELEEKLRKTEQLNEAILDLLKELNLSEAQNARLAAKVASANKVKLKLMTYRPATKGMAIANRRKLRQQTEKLGLLSARSTTTQMEADSLRILKEQLAETEIGIERMRTGLKKAEGEVKGLLDHFRDKDLEQDRRQLKAALNKKNRDLAHNTATVRTKEARKAILSELLQQLQSVSLQSDALWERMKQVSEDIAELRRSLRQPAAEAGPQPTETPAAQPSTSPVPQEPRGEDAWPWSEDEDGK